MIASGYLHAVQSMQTVVWILSTISGQPLALNLSYIAQRAIRIGMADVDEEEAVRRGIHITAYTPSLFL